MSKNSGDNLSSIPPITDKMTVPGLFHHRQKEFPGSVIVERRSEFGDWQPVTIEDFLGEVERVACGLIGLGIKAGDSVAILAANSYLWMVYDLAIMSTGAVTVPIYESDSAKQIEHILHDADVKLVFTATSQQAELVSSISNLQDGVFSWDRGVGNLLAQAAREVAPAALRDRLNALRIDDLATIIYTSGTTGIPKGVELTHRNFVATNHAIHTTLPMIAHNPQTRVLLFLPLAHVLARFVMHTIASGPGRVAFSPDTTNLIADIAAFEPTALLVVPRVLEKVYNAAQAKAGGGIKSKLFSWSAAQARQLSSTAQHSLGLKMRSSLADSLVLKKIRKVLGPRLQYIVSGGAPLAAELAHFYRGLGGDISSGLWAL